MVINVASFGGRSHMLDLARELHKKGHEVRFYSYVPTKRAQQFGLPAACNKTLFYWALPFLALFKIFGFKSWNQYLYWRVFDIFTAYYMKPCDVFIGQSPMHNFSIRYAKKKYGALTILERGTVHVLDYVEQVKEDPLLEGKCQQPSYQIAYDIDGYKYPNFISVGSEQVKDSFIKHGIAAEKIFVNNYGFDVSQFSSTVLAENPYDLIMVGRWSYPKGAALITEACKRKGYHFLHVGSLIGYPFPEIENMHHVDAVPQNKLVEYYSKAKVFVLPSYVEGLALVQMQAAACGLPIVCSEYTGGRDIRKYTTSDEWIIEMNDLTVESLISAIDNALSLAKKQTGKRNYLNKDFANASWEGYGNRYHEFLQEKINQK